MSKLSKFTVFALLTVTVLMMIPLSAHDEVTYAEWGTPEIDGVKEAAWDIAQMIEVKDVALGDLGANTATGKVWSLWDGGYLYFYAEITDPVVDSADKDEAWNQDAVGFMIDFAYDRTPDKSYRDLGADSYAGYINVTPKSAEATKFYPEGPSIFGIDGYVQGTKSFAKVVAGGYVIEARIPLLYKSYSVGDKIGYEICINNGNGGGVREGQTVWAFADGANGSNSWQCSFDMGTLILNPEVIAVVEVPAAEAAEAPAAPAVTAPAAVSVSAPQTNDAIIALAVLAVISGGAVLSLKKK